MKLPALPLHRQLVVGLLAGFCLLAANSGCSRRHANARPASSLSPVDRTILTQYEKIRVALATDDLLSARAAASALVSSLKPADAKTPPPAVLVLAQSVASAPALDRARQQFGLLSAKVIPLADGVEGYYVLTCPLPSSGDWVQPSATADNPYLGRAMHEYGQLRK